MSLSSQAAQTVMSLPMSADLSIDQQDFIVETLIAVMKR